MDPATQERQLLQAGVPLQNIHRDVGISGSTGTMSRAAWRALDERLLAGDLLVVVAIDRIGRNYLDTAGAIRDLRRREVRLRSLSATEQSWTQYLDPGEAADPVKVLVGNVLVEVFSWQAGQELENIKRRTRAGMARAVAEGKGIGRPSSVTPERLALARRLRSEGMSHKAIADVLDVSRSTIQNWLKETA